MITNLSIALEYAPKVHHGHNVGFDWNTLSCTEAEAIAKQQSVNLNPTVVELKFMPV